MPKINRAQLAFDTGQRLKDAGIALATPSTKLPSITASIGSCLISLNQLTDSLRTARNSYPNYPSLRAVLAEASDEIFAIAEKLEIIHEALKQACRDPSVSPEGWSTELISLGQKLRLVQFVPKQKETA